MTVENVNYISDLEPDRPRGSDKISLGDDHIRNIKKSLKQTFPNVDGEVKPTDEEMNFLVGVSQPIQPILDQGGADLTALEGRVTKNEADIAGHESDIAGHETRITKNEADIAQIDADLSAGAGDIAALQSQVSTNTQNISSNATAIAAKADKTYVDSELSKKADKTYVDSNLAGKVDKTYVDAQDAKKADKTYVDTELAKKADKTYVDSNLSGKADKTYVDSQDAKKADKTYVDAELVKKADKTYVDSQDALKADKTDTYTKAEIDALVAEASKGGGMIKLVQQPSYAGTFTVSSHPQAYGDQLSASGSSADRTAKLVVPQGMVFCFEYLFGFGGSSGDLFIDPEGIYFDGVQVYNISGGMPLLQYDQTGGPIWPGSDKSTIVRIEESIEIKGMTAQGAGCKVWVAGFFAEA
jgi:hypothetical protein